MNTEIQKIIDNSRLNKTKKLLALFDLGFNRRDAANLVANGNYGFAQNVWKASGRTVNQRGQAATQTQPQNTTITKNAIFSRKFGLEIEGLIKSRTELTNELKRNGIECKRENYNHETKNHWKIVKDGSIRKEEGYECFELVSPILEGHDGLNQLETVCKVLYKLGAKVNSTCGLHVHFDARNFKISTWQNLFINYANLQRTINQFLPKSRENNTYCRPLIGNAVDLKAFKTLVLGFDTVEKISSFYKRERYHNINVESFTRHGSVEFRQHGATIDFQKIKNWIMFLDKLVGFSEKGLFVKSDCFKELETVCGEELTNYFYNRMLDQQV